MKFTIQQSHLPTEYNNAMDENYSMNLHGHSYIDFAVEDD